MFRTISRTLIAVAAVGLMAAGPANAGYKSTNQSCLYGASTYYPAGTTILEGYGTHKYPYTWFICDGSTGRWKEMRAAPAEASPDYSAAQDGVTIAIAP